MTGSLWVDFQQSVILVFGQPMMWLAVFTLVFGIVGSVIYLCSEFIGWLNKQ